MSRIRFSCLVLVLGAGFTWAADEPEFSGPQPGEKLTAFKAHRIFGPSAGKEVDLLAEQKGAPSVFVFVHELTRPSRQLMLAIDRYHKKMAKEGLATHFIWLSADRAKTEDYLKRAQKSVALEAPISISVDGLEGPGNYGLNRKMTLTILVGKDNKVLSNFAIIQPNDTDAPKVITAIAKALGKEAPTKEEWAELVRPERRMPNPNEPDPALTGLMRRMIQKDNDEAKVKEIAQEMEKWAGDDAKKKAALKEYCLKVAKLGYGTEAAQKALKRLGGE